MKNMAENNFKIKKNIKNILIILLLFIAIALIYNYNTTDYVIVRFNELGPVSKNMAIYYNGFKVGKIVKIEPDDDFKHTLVRVNLIRKKLNLPQNTTVHLKSFPNGELYLQFMYPPAPSLQLIKKGERLEGITPYSLEQFMLGQNISGVSDLVSIHVIKALNAMQISNMQMDAFFKNTSALILENKKDINQSINNIEAMTKSLAETAENLNKASAKINKSLDAQVLRDSTLNVRASTSNVKAATSNVKSATSNIEDSTANVKETTENVANATKDLDKTVKKIDDTISEVNSAAKNINCITSELKQTLSKRFGGMRVMFGTPVKPKN